MEIRFLPEPKALSVVIHKVMRSHRAFPIRDLARLFLDNPNSCEVRIDLKPGPEGLSFHQCTRCGWSSLSGEALRQHAIGTHFEEEFLAEDIEGEPPAGVFVCVARCGISGKLLAPPNHHSYNQRVQDVRRARCPDLSEEEYRSRIETVRDESAIEQWREEARKRTVYRRKADEPSESESLDRLAAEAWFSREILPGMCSEPKHLACSHAVALRLSDPVLAPAIQEAWRRERRYPASLFFALRGAFRHKRLHVFRAGDGRGIDFVMARAPIALDVQHAVPELKAIVDHLMTSPACTRADLLQALGVSPEDPQGARQEVILQQLAWITERGHVIEYHNGVLALPETHPAFRMVPLPPARSGDGVPPQRSSQGEEGHHGKDPSGPVPEDSQEEEPSKGIAASEPEEPVAAVSREREPSDPGV